MAAKRRKNFVVTRKQSAVARILRPQQRVGVDWRWRVEKTAATRQGSRRDKAKGRKKEGGEEEKKQEEGSEGFTF